MKSDLQRVLNEEIPLTKSMQLSVLEANSEQVILSAPLEPNMNHKQTAFGGSLYSLAVLSGWGMVYVLLKQHKLTAHIVIHRSEINYIKPVDEKLRAVCLAADKKQLEKFFRLFERKGRARLKLSVQILKADEVAVEFIGDYVVHS